MKKLCPSISGERNLAAQCNPSLALGARGEQEFSAVPAEHLRRSGFSREKTQSATPRARLKALLRSAKPSIARGANSPRSSGFSRDRALKTHDTRAV